MQELGHMTLRFLTKILSVQAEVQVSSLFVDSGELDVLVSLSRGIQPFGRVLGLIQHMLLSTPKQPAPF